MILNDSSKNLASLSQFLLPRLTNSQCYSQDPRSLRTLTSERVYKRTLLRGQTVILRAMESDDTDKLLRFFNRLVYDKSRGNYPDVFTGFEQKVTRGQESEWLASQLVLIENRELVSVLAEISGQVVANGEVARGDYDETRHHGRLALTVLPAYRGRGIGREIVKILLREARRIGLRNLEVEFLSSNEAAVHTYQKAGFREIGRIPGKVRRNGKLIDSIIMARKI